MSYTFLEHTADVKFRAEGSTLDEMFLEAAKALFFTMRGEIIILEQEKRILEIEGNDMESLLHNFLEEFLFLLDSSDFLASGISSIEIDEDSFRIRCEVFGDKAEKYKFTNDVKAVTYNEMYVREKEGKFLCQVVLDV